MAPSTHARRTERGVDLVRAQILTALHFGRLGPGDRAPSVRRLADQTGMNRKTIHRAYRKLANEGLLDLRPGSGTFIAVRNGRSSDDPQTADLIAAINRCRSEAARIGVRPQVFSRFVHNFLGDGLGRIPLAVVECNREQLGVIVDDLETGLGVRARPVLLRDLMAGRHGAPDTMGVVTTDCHWNEVVSAVEGSGLPVYRVALDAEFPQTVACYARRGPVVLVVRDPGFAPVFRRLLRQISVPQEHVDRLTFVEWPEARRVLEAVGSDTAVYISPLVGPDARDWVNGHRRIKARWHVTPGSIDRLQARLALDAARRARTVD